MVVFFFFEMGEVVPLYYVVIAFACTVGAITLAILHIYRHLLNYTEPTYQRYIVRIIFMVPVSTLFVLGLLFVAAFPILLLSPFCIVKFKLQVHLF